MAGSQSLGGIVHFLNACLIAKYKTLKVDLSLGKIFLFITALRITLFKDSIALIVYIIFLISSG
jgi:hypothetical protein